MRFAERDQVIELGLAAVGPESDVMSVDPAGLAAGIAAPIPVPLADRAPQRRRELAGPAATLRTSPSTSWSMALMVALHAIICRVARLIAAPSSRWLRSGQAGWLSGNDSSGTVSARAASAFRVSAGTSPGACRRWCDGPRPGVDDDLVGVRVVGLGGAPGQIAGADPDEGVGEALGVLLPPRRRQRLVPGGPVPLVLAGQRLRPRFRGNVASPGRRADARGHPWRPEAPATRPRPARAGAGRGRRTRGRRPIPSAAAAAPGPGRRRRR